MNELDVDFPIEDFLRIYNKVVSLLRVEDLHYLKFIFEVFIMFYLGIDIAKNTHVASLLDETVVKYKNQA